MKRLLALLPAALLIVTACSAGKDAVDQGAGTQFGFVGATPNGQTIKPQTRKIAGNVHGVLVDGGAFQLSAERGKVVVLNYWASWCAPCQAEMPGFDKLYREIKAKGVQFFGIDNKDTRSGGTAFVKDNEISYPIVWDEETKTALQIGKGIPSQSLPFTVVIDRQGRVAAVYIGQVQAGDLQNALTGLIAET